MRITEGLMEVGDWSFSLRPEEGTTIRAALNAAVDALDGFIVVFNTETQLPSLATALYAGVLTHGDGRLSYGGTGLIGVLQDNNNLGYHVTSNVETASQSLDDWFDDLLADSSEHGITKGTVTTTGLVDVEATQYMGLGLREHLDFVTSSAGAVWTINPEGELSAAAPATLFGDTPTVIVTPSPTSEIGGSLRGVNGSVVGLLRDSRQITTRAIGYGPGTAESITVETSTNAGTLARGLTGNARRIDRPLDLPNAFRDDLGTFTAAAAARFAEVRRAFRVQASTSSVRSKVKPGDSVYVFDLDADVTGDTLVTFNGEPIKPLPVRVQRMKWSTHKGQGVWLYRPNESNPWTDLTNSMPERDGAETSSSDWTVSTDLAVADLIKSLSTDRIVVRRPDEVQYDPAPDRVNPYGGSGDQQTPDLPDVDVGGWGGSGGSSDGGDYEIIDLPSGGDPWGSDRTAEEEKMRERRRRQREENERQNTERREAAEEQAEREAEEAEEAEKVAAGIEKDGVFTIDRKVPLTGGSQ